MSRVGLVMSVGLMLVLLLSTSSCSQGSTGETAETVPVFPTNEVESTTITQPTRQPDASPTPQSAGQPDASPTPQSAAQSDASPTPKIENKPEESPDVEISSPCFPGFGASTWQQRNFVQWTPDGSELVLDYEGKLYIVKADGSQLQGIAETMFQVNIEGGLYRLGPMTYFDVSPDGSRVVYSTCKYPGEEHSSEMGFQFPEWASEVLKYEYEIAISNIDGTVTKRLTNNSVFDNYPEWSPDGTRIAFVSGDVNGVEPSLSLYTMSAEGTDVRNFVPFLKHPSGVSFYPPVWSPDGEHLAFVAYERQSYLEAARSFVFTVGADGSDLTKISETLSVPSWSPDGQRMALVRTRGDGAALYTIAAGRTDLEMVIRISEQGIWVETVSWSPDGNQILFTCGSETCVVDLDGTLSSGPTLPIVEQSTRNPLRGAAWSPDGSKIAAGTLYTTSPDGTELEIILVTNGLGLRTSTR